MSRLDRVLDDLVHAARGERRLPVVGAADAAAVCGLFHGQVDRGTAARAAAAEAAGHPEACARGCAACCAAVPVVFAGEAVTIARWLRRPEHAAARARFEAAYPGWLARLGDLLGAWAEAATAGDGAAAERLLTAAFRRGVACAFLRDGACTIYPVRPVACRTTHAVDGAARCGPESAEPPATASFVPLDEYVASLRPVVFALHAALRPDGTGAQPLCVAVMQELQAPSGARGAT